MNSKINHIRSQVNQYFSNKAKEHNKKHANNNRKLYSKYYHSTHWRDLRAYKFATTPYCEVCDRQGRVTECDEVHHARPWLTGKDEIERWQLLLDYNNLISCCTYHHQMFHDYLRRYNKKEATIDELVEYEKKYKEFI